MNKVSLINLKLDKLNFPFEINRHRSLLSVEKVAEFTNTYISKMIGRFGLERVQTVIDCDGNQYEPIIRYITNVFELAMLHELFYQAFASENENVLKQRMELLVWTINISVANELIVNGVKRIPEIENTEINFYYSWNAMEQIIKRVWPIANQIDGAMPNEVGNYIDNLISLKL